MNLLFSFFVMLSVLKFTSAVGGWGYVCLHFHWWSNECSTLPSFPSFIHFPLLAPTVIYFFTISFYSDQDLLMIAVSKKRLSLLLITNTTKSAGTLHTLLGMPNNRYYYTSIVLFKPCANSLLNGSVDIRSLLDWTIGWTLIHPSSRACANPPNSLYIIILENCL